MYYQPQQCSYERRSVSSIWQAVLPIRQTPQIREESDSDTVVTNNFPLNLHSDEKNRRVWRGE